MANAKNGASFERVAALYDVHGNLHALEAALEDVRDAQVDRIVFGGDVFPGPLSHSALELLLSLTPQPLFLHGNGDREVLRLANGEPPSALPETVLAGMRWEAERLSERHRAQLERWPATLRLEVQGVGRVLFCHATPRNDTDVFTRETAEPKLRPHFAEVDADLVVVGHTHMQFDRRVGSARVVNAGSVGMPFGDAGAHWLLLGPEVEHRVTPYDLSAAADTLRASEHPQAEEFVRRYVLDRPTEREILDLYGKAELA